MGVANIAAVPKISHPIRFPSNTSFRALGGSDEENNLAFSCQGCNGVKGVRVEAFDEVTAALVRLFHPRTDAWNDHFRWSADSLQVEGIFAIGRATVGLQLGF